MGAQGRARDTTDAAPADAGCSALNRINRSAATPGSGAEELATYFIGQVVGSIDSVRPADRVVLDMVEEFIDTIDGLAEGLAT